MKNEKTCKKCDKQFPSNTIFCPDCGSLTMSPGAPVETAPLSPVRAKRTSARGTPVRSLPSRSLPPAVRTTHSMSDFSEALIKNDVPEDDVKVIRRLIEWSEGVSDSVSFGDTIAESGRIGYRSMIRLQDRDVGLFWISTDGKIEIQFEDWIHIAPFDSREKRFEMLKRLNEIKGVKIPGDKVAGRPPVPVRMLRDPAEYDKFIGIYEWFISLVRGQ